MICRIKSLDESIQISKTFVLFILRILTGKQAPSNKTPALTESRNMDI